MSKEHHEVIFHEMKNKGCSAQEETALMDNFERMAKRVTLARKAWFDLKDFMLSNSKGINGFTLTVARDFLGEEEIWRGTYICKDKQLTVMATLENY